MTAVFRLDQSNGRAPRTELDAAELLVQRYCGHLRFCAALGGWHEWTGTHWRRDDREQAREHAKSIARQAARAAARSFDQERFATAKRLSTARGVSAVLELARSDKRIVFSPADADRDPWKLNVRNGTVDLKTGLLGQHERVDLITRVAPVAYSPDATAPLFERFLSQIQPDPEVRAYLARLFGYAAIGEVNEHVLAVLWGAGANGKSVLVDQVSYVLGDYARPGPTSLVVQTGAHEPHPTDIATCCGSRLVVLHETRRGAGFDASKLKLLTGGDTLTARHMREDYFQFRPTHTLVMLSNYRPKADASDAALWRRVHLVLFPVVIAPENRDGDLANKLRAEAPGILRWVIDGAREWQRIGLAPPPCVLAQTELYRREEDTIGMFIDECVERSKGSHVRAGVLYHCYRRWCDNNSHSAVNNTEFGREIAERGFTRVSRDVGRVYIDVSLRNCSPDAGV